MFVSSAFVAEGSRLLPKGWDRDCGAPRSADGGFGLSDSIILLREKGLIDFDIEILYATQYRHSMMSVLDPKFSLLRLMYKE